MQTSIKTGSTSGIKKERVSYDKPSDTEWKVLLALPWPRGQLKDAIETLYDGRKTFVLASDVIWTHLRFQTMNRFLRRHGSEFRLRIRQNTEVRRTGHPWFWSENREGYLGRLIGPPSQYPGDPDRWPKA